MYNATIKTVLNLPNKTPKSYMKKILGTWNHDVLIDVSFANATQKWT